MFAGSRNSVTLNKEQRMTFFISDKISASGHLVKHICQIFYLRLQKFLRNTIHKNFPIYNHNVFKLTFP